MPNLEEIYSLRELDVAQAARYLDVEPGDREPYGSYGRLEGLDVLKSPEVPAIRFFLKGDSVELVYIGRAAFPPGLTEGSLRAAFNEPQTEFLRSRQGRMGEMAVMAEAGIAWSSLGEELGWIELFRPRSFEQYQHDIYEPPPMFIH